MLKRVIPWGGLSVLQGSRRTTPRALVYESHCPHYFQFIKSRLVLECSSNACQAKIRQAPFSHRSTSSTPYFSLTFLILHSTPVLIRTPFRPSTLHLSPAHPPEGGPYTSPTTVSAKRATSQAMTPEDTCASIQLPATLATLRASVGSRRQL